MNECFNSQQVLAQEVLARYILQKSHFSIQQQRVKYAVFLPAPNGKTSVFRISNLTENEIWELGSKEVAQKRHLPLLGRADISACAVFSANLKITPDNTPPRHANITAWPEEKSAQKLIAMQLASQAQLYLK